MNARRWLAGMLCCGTIVACGPVDLQGLDFREPSDARKYVAACARGAQALHCKAILPVLQTVEGPVTVLIPNNADSQIVLDLREDLRVQGLTTETFLGSPAAERFARANIFAASKLSTGIMRTVDGKTHTIKCVGSTSDASEECVIDDQLAGRSRMDGVANAVGSVYTMAPALGKKRAYLPFE